MIVLQIISPLSRESDKNLTSGQQLSLHLHRAHRNEATYENGCSTALTGIREMLDPVAGKLEHYMDLLSVRQKLVASNIANADTPGYHTKDIDFESEYQAAIGGTPEVRDVSGLSVKNDGNNVSLDRESRLLAENDLRFQVATSLLRSEIHQVQSAIEVDKTS
jgi:flagellar basal-body rod protein FlgB